MATAFDAALARVAAGSDLQAQARTLVGEMTLDERLELLDGDVDFWPGLADMIGGGYVEHTFPGGSCKRLGVPGIQFADGPRGAVVGPATCFPVSMARGATFDIDLEERVGDAIGAELRERGANFYGGVCVNLLRHPAWGRAQETYGEDPVLLGEMGAALTRGAQRHVMACVKHYALNSMENTRFAVDVTVDDRVLHEVYLPHFRRIVSEGVAAVMSAYNSVNGEWCGENRHLLTDILRDQWGFDGIVISDFIFGLRHAAASVRAGLDIEMPFRMIRNQHLAQELAHGAVTAAEIDSACTRIVATQLRFAPTVTRAADDVRLLSPAHLALSREVAQRSIVLLRNEGRLLPLHGGESVAVIGALAAIPNLGDRGSSRVDPPSVVTPLDGIREAFDSHRVAYADGADSGEAWRVAAMADVAIVVVGYTAADEGEYVGLEGTAHLQPLYPPQTADTPALLQAAVERSRQGNRAMGPGGDRASLELSHADCRLIETVVAANPNTVVCIMSGSAVIMESWRRTVPAIMMVWYPGMEGGHALADVLLGRVNPSGRLPFSIPTDIGHLPAFDRRATAVTYDRWHGYTKLARDGHAAAYAFGFGLSYTTFAIGEVTAADAERSSATALTVSVKNTGTCAGRDVVHVYANAPGGTVERAETVLVAFAATPVLQPGEAHTLTFTVRHETLAIWQPAGQCWVVEPGLYRLVVARHSADAEPITVTVRVAGTV